MTSIRRQLTVRLLAVTLLLALACGAGLFAFVRARLVAEFDDALLAEARSISASVVVTIDGRLELDYVTGGGPDVARAAYFEIRWPNGTVFRRSPSLGDRDLPEINVRSGAPEFPGLALPGDRAGRGVAFRFRPQPDPDEEPNAPTPKPSPAVAATPPELTIVLAADRATLDSTLRVLGSSMLLAALTLCAGTALAVVWTIRRGLRPLVRLANEVDAIRGSSLHQRFSTQSLPAELRPIGERLNELLARLQQAFERERRFTADAAHELRTPIAELRSLAEVALHWPQDDSPPQTYRDVLEIARHMEALVGALLDLARCNAGGRRASAEVVNLSELVRECWQPHEALAYSRELDVRFDLAERAVVRSDRAMLCGIVGNLLSNAAAHAVPGGRIECHIRSADRCVELAVLNSCDDLKEEDLPHVFEPFWRKDAARSGGDHLGLGLSLAVAYASVIGAELRADLSPSQHVFTVSMRLPAEQTSDHSSASFASGRLPVTSAFPVQQH